MTVAELIALLKTEDPSAVVWAEGCDCVNPVEGASSDYPGTIGLLMITIGDRR